MIRLGDRILKPDHTTRICINFLLILFYFRKALYLRVVELEMDCCCGRQSSHFHPYIYMYF